MMISVDEDCAGEALNIAKRVRGFVLWKEARVRSLVHCFGVYTSSKALHHKRFQQQHHIYHFVYLWCNIFRGQPPLVKSLYVEPLIGDLPCIVDCVAVYGYELFSCFLKPLNAPPPTSTDFL